MINFLADFSLLLLVRLCLNQTATWLRLCRGSIAGAAGACMIICCPGLFGTFWGSICTLLLAAVMVKLTFRIQKRIILIQHILVLYLSAGLLAGILHGIYNTPWIHHLNLRAAQPDNLSFIKWLLLFLPALGICAFLLYFDTSRRKAKRCIFPVDIEAASTIIHTTGLLDTGNALCEPISQKPVCVIEAPLMKDLMTGAFAKKHLRVIPYQAIGTSQGMMMGLVVDRIVVHGRQGEVYETRQGVLGVCPQNLSQNGSYHLIIHPKYLEV